MAESNRSAQDSRAERASARRAPAGEAPAHGTPDPEDVGPGPEVERRAPDDPRDLPRRSWLAVLKGSVREFGDDELADRAAALTYYGVLSFFPALLVLVSLLGLGGTSTTEKVLAPVRELTPGPARDVLGRAVEQLQGHAATGSVMAVVGLVVALWSASGYVGAFMRAANQVYDMPEGRPMWKLLPLWITPGSVLALLVWAAASAGFALYVGAFASYNRTYGTMAGVIVFLVWLWIGNLALLLGLEFDAEAVRQRAVLGGMPSDEEPYTEPRDTRAWDARDLRRVEGPGPNARDPRFGPRGGGSRVVRARRARRAA
ncbi:YihY/virulence factor BrkB family protein [Streptomyces sp. NPDC057021]|uniref:YihY/virulence factor BrkB family protein n=2 Tax=unclassified Streptomyces TaxID=2593676 RepID=UPI003634AFFB